MNDRTEKRIILTPIAAMTGYLSWKIWPEIIGSGDPFHGDPFAIILFPFLLAFLAVAIGILIAFVWAVVGIIMPDWVLVERADDDACIHDPEPKEKPNDTQDPK